MRVTGRAIFSGILFIFFALFVWSAKDWPPVVRLFPWSIGFPMLIITFALLIGELRRTPEVKRPDSSAMHGPGVNSLDTTLVRSTTLITFSWIVGTFAAIWLFGFFITIPIVVFLYLKIQSGEGWTLSLALAGACWLMLAGIFDRVLHLPFPEGIAFELLKTFF
jgi:Tripartite tricarboxylate transporter TctB family